LSSGGQRRGDFGKTKTGQPAPPSRNACLDVGPGQGQPVGAHLPFPLGLAGERCSVERAGQHRAAAIAIRMPRGDFPGGIDGAVIVVVTQFEIGPFGIPRVFFEIAALSATRCP